MSTRKVLRVGKTRIIVPKFEYCRLCLLRAQLANQPPQCPARDQVKLDGFNLQTIVECTPFERWETPKEIGKRFGYSAKHVIRLATEDENQIARVNIFGRWLVSQCSFHNYLEHSANDDGQDDD
jgi:hypothetical protein